MREGGGDRAEKGASVNFAIDDKYKEELDAQFRPISYDELYKAWREYRSVRGTNAVYYLYGEESIVHVALAVPTALARPTLTTSQNLNETVKTPK